MKRDIVSNKNYFLAIVLFLFSCLQNLNEQKVGSKLTEVWEPVRAIVTPGE